MNMFLKEEKNQNPSTPTQAHGPGWDPKEQRPKSSHVFSGAPDHILLWQKGKSRERPYFVQELQGLSAAGEARPQAWCVERTRAKSLPIRGPVTRGFWENVLKSQAGKVWSRTFLGGRLFWGRI